MDTGNTKYPKMKKRRYSRNPITTFEAFVWRIQALQNMHHLIWQLITDHVAV